MVDRSGLELWETDGCEVVSIPHDNFGDGGETLVFCVSRSEGGNNLGEGF